MSILKWIKRKVEDRLVKRQLNKEKPFDKLILEGMEKKEYDVGPAKVKGPEEEQ